ncbi:hypothetical protein N7510_009599 [Penicillium lagena]|uniref:uncharacterized protein n=1 Tax=Penicillium lagena TaxID=94218 RepID=UPI002540F1D7|nr:uncharacterized protein N7510_009599 [Penicillium lagena]KAJ5604445.1 hypothetical protein N7510_009599 [Penicillium lagena]
MYCDCLFNNYTGSRWLYHTAHIVINTGIRHLQVAGGATDIFGHIVTPADHQISSRRVKMWAKTHSAAVDHAAWHAAQRFREGLSYLKNCDVNGMFHSPWCLVIGTLTCYASHHFGAEEQPTILCTHAGGRGNAAGGVGGRL